LSLPGLAPWLTPKALQQKIHELEGQMMQHAQNLEFEEAAQIRDQLASAARAVYRRLLSPGAYCREGVRAVKAGRFSHCPAPDSKP
jgi:hypothetical protein